MNAISCPCGHGRRQHRGGNHDGRCSQCRCAEYGVGVMGDEPTGSLDLPGDPIEQGIPAEPGEARKRSGRKAVPPAKKSKLDRVREQVGTDVEQGLGLMSLAFVPFSPTAAEFNEANAAATTDAVLRLCIRHPHLIEIIRLGGDATAYVEVAKWLAALLLGFAADRGKVDPEMFACRVLGVSDAYKIVHGEEEAHGTNGNGRAAPSSTTPPILEQLSGVS